MPKIAETSRVIMGIDPGTNYTGYGFLRTNGRKAECLVLGFIDLSKFDNPYSKLGKIYERVSHLIKEYEPDEVAFESPFFGENVQSMLKLGRAQGVAMAAALSHGLPVYEYAPRRIKQIITGNGGASKEQVASLLCKTLGVEYSLKKLDATDGLAVALCHHFESTSLMSVISGGKKSASLGSGLSAASRKGSSSWESFVSKNPGRVKKENGK